jgi:hypothetical protein
MRWRSARTRWACVCLSGRARAAVPARGSQGLGAPPAAPRRPNQEGAQGAGCACMPRKSCVLRRCTATWRPKGKELILMDILMDILEKELNLMDICMPQVVRAPRTRSDSAINRKTTEFNGYIRKRTELNGHLHATQVLRAPRTRSDSAIKRKTTEFNGHFIGRRCVQRRRRTRCVRCAGTAIASHPT